MIFIFLRDLVEYTTYKKFCYYYYYVVIIIILHFCKAMFGKNLISLEKKTTQNKPKRCLPNTPLNQKKLQTKQGLMTDPVLTQLG